MSNLSIPASSGGYPSFSAGSPPSDGENAPSLNGQPSPDKQQLGNKGSQQQGIDNNNSFNPNYSTTDNNSFGYATGSSTYDATGSSSFDYSTGSSTYDATGSSGLDYSTGSSTYDATGSSSFDYSTSETADSYQKSNFQDTAKQTGNVRAETNFRYNTNLPPQAGTTQNSNFAGQAVAQNVGQSINQDVTQNLAGTQGFGGSSDASVSSNSNDATQNIPLDQAPVSDSGLTVDQQVTGQHSENQHSDTGSGGHSRDDHSGGKEAAYAFGPKPSSTTVMSSQRGQGSAISAHTILSQLGKPGQAPLAQQAKSNIQYQNPLQLSHAATSYISNTIQAKTNGLGLGSLSLKIDPKIATLQTAASKAQTLVFINENKAPALPPSPNVYAMIATSQELSTNVLGLTVDGMVSANNGMNLIEQSEFATQIKDINNAISASHKSNSKAQTAKVFGWIMNVSMIVVGALLIASGAGAGLGAALIIGGVLGCIMMSPAGTQMSNGLTNALVAAGCPKKDAAILAQVIICVIMIVASAGGGGIISAAGSALTAASEAAVAAAEEAALQSVGTTTEVATRTGQVGENAAQAASTSTKLSEAEGNIIQENAENALKEPVKTPAKKMPPLNKVYNALKEPEGYQAFTQELSKSLEAAPRAALDSMTQSAQDLLTAAKNSPEDAMKAVSWAAKSSSETMAQMSKSLSLFAERTAASCKTLLNEGMSLEEASSAVRDAAASGAKATAELGRATASQMKTLLASMNLYASPTRAALQIAQVTQIALGLGSAVTGYQASKEQAIATEASADVQISQASTTSLQQQITLGMSQMNMILDGMNGSIASTASVLGGMVSDNPLMNLSKSA